MIPTNAMVWTCLKITRLQTFIHWKQQNLTVISINHDEILGSWFDADYLSFHIVNADIIRNAIIYHEETQVLISLRRSLCYELPTNK